MGQAVAFLANPAFWKGAATVASVASAGASVQSSVQSRKATKSAQAAADQANQKAIADAQAARDKASSQAMGQIDARKRAIARSQSVYTSPLGIGTMASTARKTLLGQ